MTTGLKPSKLKPFNAEDLSLIDRFRGLPRNPVRKTRSPNQLSSSLGRVLASLRVSGEDTPEQTILAEWANLIGPNYAKRCAPGRLQKDGTLIILAPNPIVRQELGFQRRAILNRIWRLPGCGRVRSLLLRGG